MRTAFRLAIALLGVGVGVVACGDDAPGDPIYGTWEVTQSEYVSATEPPVMVDLIAAGGSGSLELNADASYDATIVPPGGASEHSTGTWSFTESTLSLRESGSAVTWTFDRVIEGDMMVLAGADAGYDFDGDGTPEPATWNVTLTLDP
jgi:hypothetical protein